MMTSRYITKAVLHALETDEATAIEDYYGLMDVSRPTARRVMRRMIDIGYFTATSHPDDQRRKLVRRTTRLEGVFDQGAELYFDFLKRVLARMPDGEPDSVTYSSIDSLSVPVTEEQPNFARLYRIVSSHRLLQMSGYLDLGLSRRFLVDAFYKLFSYGSVSLTDVARSTNFTPPTLRQWVSEVVARGFLEIVPGPDHRTKALRPTARLAKLYDNTGIILLDVGRRFVAAERDWHCGRRHAAISGLSRDWPISDPISVIPDE